MDSPMGGILTSTAMKSDRVDFGSPSWPFQRGNMPLIGFFPSFEGLKTPELGLRARLMPKFRH